MGGPRPCCWVCSLACRRVRSPGTWGSAALLLRGGPGTGSGGSLSLFLGGASQPCCWVSSPVTVGILSLAAGGSQPWYWERHQPSCVHSSSTGGSVTLLLEGSLALLQGRSGAQVLGDSQPCHSGISSSITGGSLTRLPGDPQPFCWICSHATGSLHTWCWRVPDQESLQACFWSLQPIANWGWGGVSQPWYWVISGPVTADSAQNVIKRVEGSRQCLRGAVLSITRRRSGFTPSLLPAGDLQNLALGLH